MWKKEYNGVPLYFNLIIISATQTAGLLVYSEAFYPCISERAEDENQGQRYQ